ncbi:MAG: DUF2461 domain-containing protein [Candidatus Kerfeldbacteria bacterium]|nr:DUF2461 domain-containing protein [Candidatus Kerfeldbacteria bacterium]
MQNNQQKTFQRFSEQTIQFLGDLQSHNNKTWFEAHREDYQQFVLEPLQALVQDLSNDMLMIDSYFEVTPAVNRTISRIHRDTRFSKDKSPYKTAMWITFKRPTKEWKDAPAYFFELSPESYRYGMGFYSASPDTMARLRELMEKKTKEFIKAIQFYPKQNIFTLEGEQYKKVLNPNLPAEIQSWYQRKNIYLVRNTTIDQTLFSKQLVTELAKHFQLLAPLYQFWNTLVTKV